MKRKSVSIVRLLREQQEIYEEKLAGARKELTECYEMHRSLKATLESLERTFPDMQEASKDLRYLREFCEQFWANPSSTPLTEDKVLPLPKSATEIFPNVPEDKKPRFWLFVERLMSLFSK